MKLYWSFTKKNRKNKTQILVKYIYWNLLHCKYKQLNIILKHHLINKLIKLFKSHLSGIIFYIVPLINNNNTKSCQRFFFWVETPHRSTKTIFRKKKYQHIFLKIWYIYICYTAYFIFAKCNDPDGIWFWDLSHC
jgi:hypothetical protein